MCHRRKTYMSHIILTNENLVSEVRSGRLHENCTREVMFANCIWFWLFLVKINIKIKVIDALRCKINEDSRLSCSIWHYTVLVGTVNILTFYLFQLLHNIALPSPNNNVINRFQSNLRKFRQIFGRSTLERYFFNLKISLTGKMFYFWADFLIFWYFYLHLHHLEF